MRKILFLAILTAGLGIGVQAQTGARQTIVLSHPWKFSKGDFKGAQNPAFDDSGWQTVRLPHDWAIAGPFDPLGQAETGKLPWKGEGWYRYTFTPDPALQGKQLTLLFDGVMAFPTIWLNGKEIGRWDYGYNSFYLDISDQIEFGKPNVLAVHADTRRHDSRWYPGAGIYRKVSLIATDPVHVAQWGTQVTTTKITPQYAVVKVCAHVRNDGKQDEQRVSIEQQVLDQEGFMVGTTYMSFECPIKARETH